ncbi:MAG: ATP-binding protein, partial [Balneolaceae bacterium]
MSNNTYRLLLKSSFQESEKVPAFVSEIQQKEGLNDEDTGKLMLALSEAVSNAIVHGNREDSTKEVQTEVLIRTGEIVSLVKDEGKGFNPEKADDPLQEENLLKEGGRGIFLIRQICDEVEFRDGGRTICFV